MKEILDIERLEQSSAAGPKPSFSKYDILKTLEVIYREGSLGRKKLSSILNLGEGATRTILDHLQKASIVRKTRLGCELTEKGKKIGQEITRKIAKHSPLQENILVAGKFAYGILVKGSASRITNGIEQRDAAIKAGAKSATTIICKNENLIMPPETRMPPKEYSETLKMIYALFEPQNNDVIIISGADDMFLAELGARAGTWTLLES